MNPLSSLVGSWVGDGYPGTLIIDGPTITLASQNQGTPYNVMLDSIIPAKNIYYEIFVLSLEEASSLGVGIVKKEEFLPGWKTRGMFYNGNLSNGSAGLVIGFGERLQAKHNLGVCIRRENKKLTVIFYLNGRCLGKAFQLQDVNPADTYHPCLHISGKAVLKYSAPSELPSMMSRQPETHSDAYSGDWKLVQAFSGPELGEFLIPSDAKVILSFKSTLNEGNYRLSVKVANNMGTNVTLVGKDDGFDKIEIAPLMSTRMMPSPDLFKVETFISSALPTFYKMIINGNLVMTGATAKCICERYEKSFEPLNSYN